eukprot:gnl/TRDRNA2_/TRDRNA2_133973_c2_seq1.p1 gnl/TRDRNA2_/TRDRNA2_133973_c2~~gnl/TRDRNA2_/TRDRNA2_133973_c2_seq1.p1  ORF type:complete len:217 (+),score=28.56 gnl/TRDRNA2_/TRDRNA2_133973_c2_seq1:3-653(+)
MYSIRYRELCTFFAQASDFLISHMYCDLAFKSFAENVAAGPNGPFCMSMTDTSPWMYLHRQIELQEQLLSESWGSRTSHVSQEFINPSSNDLKLASDLLPELMRCFSTVSDLHSELQLGRALARFKCHAEFFCANNYGIKRRPDEKFTEELLAHFLERPPIRIMPPSTCRLITLFILSKANIMKAILESFGIQQDIRVFEAKVQTACVECLQSPIS